MLDGRDLDNDMRSAAVLVERRTRETEEFQHFYPKAFLAYGSADCGVMLVTSRELLIGLSGRSAGQFKDCER